MPFVVGAAILVGAIATLNLLLTFGVIRRLRKHTEKLAARPVGSSPDLLLGVGESPGEFAATTTAGEATARTSLMSGQLIGFFSPNCEPCKDIAPKFVDHAATMAGGREQVLAVVVADEDEGESLVRLLEPVAKVVIEPVGGPVSKAFNVRGFPALCVLDVNRTVAASGFELGRLREPISIS